MRCSASNCPTLHLSASAFPVISGLLAAGCWRSGTGLTTGHLTLVETLLHLQRQCWCCCYCGDPWPCPSSCRAGWAAAAASCWATPSTPSRCGSRPSTRPACSPPSGAACSRCLTASLPTQPRVICTLHPAGGAAVAAAGALLPALLGGRHQLPLLRRVHAGPRADTGRQAQARCRTYRGQS